MNDNNDAHAKKSSQPVFFIFYINWFTVEK